MRFFADGPDIPDELLVAREAGEVILFCGAGVSRAKAKLPDFGQLAKTVIDSLGSAQDSLARSVFEHAKGVPIVPGVGGLVATDRLFGLLEREFFVRDIRAAVAQAVKPRPGVDLQAHRTLLDLASFRNTTRLVTTNFDLLFEECDSTLSTYGPPQLPDPDSERGLNGIVHLHGRVNADYTDAEDEEFVVSSADFGRAYLTRGWATQFIQRLLSKFQILFIGYSADDPPVQYILEGLNLKAGTTNRLYALQNGDQQNATAQWESRGVRAISFDPGNDFKALWDTLEAWAERARDNNRWYEQIISKAAAGPKHLAPHERGQIVHMLSTEEGGRYIARAPVTLPAEWILVCDAAQRYATPETIGVDIAAALDPFDQLGLDSDPSPSPLDPEDRYRERKAPNDALDVLSSNPYNQELRGRRNSVTLSGAPDQLEAELPPRLLSIAQWFARVAHQPVALWWAADREGLHPFVVRVITGDLLHEAIRFPEPIRRQWRLLLSSWAARRLQADQAKHAIERQAADGWSASLVRELAAVYRPKLEARRAHGNEHPISWPPTEQPTTLVYGSVEYPHPYGDIPELGPLLPHFLDCYRANFDFAIAIEYELLGTDRLSLHSCRLIEENGAFSRDEYGLTGTVIIYQKALLQLFHEDAEQALRRAQSWPTNDDGIYARLRLWAAGEGIFDAASSGKVFLSLSEKVFWGFDAQGDLLLALRDRWPSLAAEDRAALEEQLLTGSYPWEQQPDDQHLRYSARARLDRLQWLASNGVNFSFDLRDVIEKEKTLVPDWEPEMANRAVESSGPKVFGIGSDTEPHELLSMPIADLLQVAQEQGRIDYSRRIHRDPFAGLSVQRPARALAALSYQARLGHVPAWAWATFLRSEKRLTDRSRLIRAVASRLTRLAPADLGGFIDPMTAWMERIADRLYGDTAPAFPLLWISAMAALGADTASSSGPKRRRAAWAENSPTGQLFKLLLADPAWKGAKEGGGLPWPMGRRLEQLLDLKGDTRLDALVMAGFHIRRLYWVDPTWTETLLGAAAGNADEADALWVGILSNDYVPQPPLYAILKPALVCRALNQERRKQHNVRLAGFIVFGWGSSPTTPQIITDLEFREILINGDDELRRQILKQLEHEARLPDSQWRPRVLPFFHDVWPKQKACYTPTMSAHLANFALNSGDLMPAIVETLLPRLIPIRMGQLGYELTDEQDAENPARRYPKSTLDLLYAIVPADPAGRPFRIEVAIDLLSSDPKTAVDPRLQELKRRLDLA